MGMISGTSQAGIYGAVVTANCSNSPSDRRIVMASTRYGLGRNYTGEAPDESIQKLLMEPSPLVLCRPSYTMDTRRVVMDDSGSLVSGGSRNESTTRRADQLPITQWDLVENILQSIDQGMTAASGPARSEVQDIGAHGSTRSMLDDFMYCLVSFLNPDDITDILDIELMQRELEKFYSIVATQIAKDYLMEPADGQVSGDVTADQQRLRIRGLSFYMMQAILALLVVAGAVLCFLAPCNVTSRDPGSAGGLAAIMSESPSFYESLAGCGIVGLASLRDRLSNYRALGSMQLSDGKPEYRVIMVSEKPDGPVKDGEENSSWWKPLAISRITKTGVTIYLLLLVVALESTYQASVRNDGLANVETKSYVRYAWSYVPALSMFVAQLLVGMIGDISKILAPFHELRRKGPVPTKALFNDPLSELTVQTLVNSIPTKQFALLATSFTMLLTPLLTIVASGLFSPETAPYTRDVTAKFDDMFNLTNSFPSTDTSAFIVGLLLQSNLSYPAWTHGELALPQMSVDGINMSDPSINGSTLQITVPAPRASLNCAHLSNDQISVFWDDRLEEPRVSIPRLSVNNTDNDTDCDSFYSGIEGANSSESRPFGYTQHSQYGCNYIRGVYGTSTSDNSSAQAFYCTPSVEQIHVNLTLHLLSYAILDATPLNDTATPYVPMSPDWDWTIFNLANILPGAGYNTTNTTTGSYDAVFQALLDQSADTPTASFPHLAQTLQHLFRLAFAQFLNLEFRTPVSSSSPMNATLTVPTRLRLKQSPISTRILEALLLAIAACLLASFALLTNTRTILPKNPCSVAAAASLLADARMLRQAPRGVTWWKEEDLAGRRVFGDEGGFSMGFWDGEASGREEGKGRRRFGIDNGMARGE